MCGRLTHSFGNRRAGDTVLSSGYSVRNALSRHFLSPQMNMGLSRNAIRSNGVASWSVSISKGSVPPENTGQERETDIMRRQQGLRFAARLALAANLRGVT